MLKLNPISAAYSLKFPHIMIITFDAPRQMQHAGWLSRGEFVTGFTVNGLPCVVMALEVWQSYSPDEDVYGKCVNPNIIKILTQ